MERAKNSNGELMWKDVRDESIETRQSNAPDTVRILNISQGAANLLIQLNQIPSIRINRNARVFQKDLIDFVTRYRGKGFYENSSSLLVRFFVSTYSRMVISMVQI